MLQQVKIIIRSNPANLERDVNKFLELYDVEDIQLQVSQSQVEGHMEPDITYSCLIKYYLENFKSIKDTK